MLSYRQVLGLVLFGLSPFATAQVVRYSPVSCLDPTSDLTAPASQQLVFADVWTQLDIGQTAIGQRAGGFVYSTRPPRDSTTSSGNDDKVLRFVLTGTTGDESEGYSNSTSYLSTIDLSSDILTFQIATNESALCSSIRTPSAATGTTTNGSSTLTDSGCPYGPGEVALGLDVPLGSSYPLTTITTRIVVLDPSVPPLHLACYDLEFTPYYPSFFPYALIRFLVVGLLAAYFFAYLVARVWASHTDFVHESETQLATSLTLKLSSTETAIPTRKVWGSVWYSAWAGRQVVGSGSLRRYVTAEFRELWHVAVWWTLVGTVAVEWPEFAYPVFAKTAWTSLIYNSTLPFTSPAHVLLPSNFTAPTTFATQMADPTSPLYLNSTLPNVLLDLSSSKPGIEKWATSVGVRPEDLFSVCAFTFFVICAAVIVGHLVFFAIDSIQHQRGPPRRSPRSPASKAGAAPTTSDKSATLNDDVAGRRDTDFYESDEDAQTYAMRALPEDEYPAWLLHWSLLQGNLLRILFLFHLPLTLFSVFEITKYGRAHSSFGLAIATLVVVCVVVPCIVLWRLHVKPVRELFTSLPLLLSLGTMYTAYSDECTMFGGVRLASNIIVGVLIGAAQTVGTAQAAVVLLVEVTDTLVTSLWLPWGDNAAMGPLAFVLSISRIITAVLLVVLSPAVNVSNSAAAWLAYIVFLMQGLVLALLLVIVAVKLVELGVRIITKVPFDESRSPRSGGIHGALRKWDRAGGKKRGRGGTSPSGGQRRRDVEERRRRNLDRGQRSPSEDTIGTQTRMLPGRPTHASQQSRTSSSISSSYADYKRGPPPNQQVSPIHFEDDGFIMSAMSSNSWGGPSTGYVKPGSYSGIPPPQQHQQPILRAGPAWGDQVTVVQAPPPLIATFQSPPPSKPSNSGFTRVGGGKTSASNPYQLANASAAYPPYPVSSADLYSTSPPGNPRRMSQSAVIEMASAMDPPSPAALPSSSALLSNTVKPYRTERRPSIVVAPKGFFGRFKTPKRVGSAEFSSDEDATDESEDEGRRKARGGWGLRFGGVKGKRRREEVREEALEEEEEGGAAAGGGESGFVVTRKQRPRPSPAGSSSNAVAAAAAAGEGGTLKEGPSPPILSVEAPSDTEDGGEIGHAE